MESFMTLSTSDKLVATHSGLLSDRDGAHDEQRSPFYQPETAYAL